MQQYLIDKIFNLKNEYEKTQSELENLDPEKNLDKYIAVNKKISDLSEIYKKILNWEKIKNSIKEALLIIEQNIDEDLVSLAKEELSTNKTNLENLEKEIINDLVPSDENDNKNAIVEIRAAAGGDEASIFVEDLFRMYTRYFEINNWKIEVLEAKNSFPNGYSEISFMVKGKNAYKTLKWESGVHRVQRVPKTETKGRVHTSTVSVAVLPEMDEVDVKINPADLKIDTYRAGGAGGQHVNKTESAVRITHLPTNIIVACQDGRSQHENREQAMKLLRAKVYEHELNKQNSEISSIRKQAVGTGDRSEKIRTYNYPQNRVTDHRIDLTLNQLEFIMDGKMQSLVDALLAYEYEQRIKE